MKRTSHSIDLRRRFTLAQVVVIVITLKFQSNSSSSYLNAEIESARSDCLWHRALWTGDRRAVEIAHIARQYRLPRRAAIVRDERANARIVDVVGRLLDVGDVNAVDAAHSAKLDDATTHADRGQRERIVAALTVRLIHVAVVGRRRCTHVHEHSRICVLEHRIELFKQIGAESNILKL